MKPETMERIDACLEGSISREEFEELQDALRGDSAALDYWCQQAEVHGRLEWELAPAAESTLPFAPRRKTYPWFSAAALVLLGLGMGLVIRPHPARIARVTVPEPAENPPPIPVRAALVARLTSSEGARWNGESPVSGEWLPAGPLDLASGTALITFDCGATVQLVGPARLHLMSATRSLLEAGEARVNITRQAYGFVFETPTVEISRRRSRFQALVDRQGHTELQIEVGQVQVAGKLGDLHTMAVGHDHGIRIDEKGDVVPFSVTGIPRVHSTLPENTDLLPDWYLHWGFDGADDASGKFTETGKHPDLGHPFSAQARLADQDAAVALVPGRFGNAIHLNGQRSFLDTGFPGFEGNSPRSIAFWVKVDPGTPDTLAYSILSWGRGSHVGGQKWQVSWNTGSDNSGIRGAIRTEVEGGFQVGSTNLLTGTWHHVVTVFAGGDGADIGENLRLYVDGRLESTTAVKSNRVNTVTGAPDSLPLTIGRRIEKEGSYRSFCGDIDEIYLFPSALTPEQVDRLYRNNQPPRVK